MKQKRIKQRKYESNDTKEIKSLIIITLAVLLLAVGLYYLTDYINNKKTAEQVSTSEIDYDRCIVGNMFNRPYDEYYVFVYNPSSEDYSSIKSLITSYIAKEDAIKLYSVDLSEKLNEFAISEKTNQKPINAAEVKVKDSALFKISKGVVTEYYGKLDQYKSVLK